MLKYKLLKDDGITALLRHNLNVSFVNIFHESKESLDEGKEEKC